MKDWKPEDKPHTSKKKFPFHSTGNSPVAGGRAHLGRPRPTNNEMGSGNAHTRDWAIACDYILTLVANYNAGLLEYKKADPEGQDPDGIGNKHYKPHADTLRNFLKGTGGGPTGQGYLDFFERGFFVFEAIESQGFILSARIVGMTKEAKSKREERIRTSHSSSSLYSIYGC